jgi:hypothetical protein
VAELYISWETVPSAVTYNIYKSVDGGAVYNSLAVGLTDTHYTDFAGDINYFYKIAGVDQYGFEGQLSDPIQGYDPASSCRVTASIIDVDGSPSETLTEICCYVYNRDLPRFAQDNLLTRRQISVYPDWRGIVQFPLVRGALVMIAIKNTGFQLRVQVPDQAEIDLKDLIPLGVVIRGKDKEYMEYPF